MGEEEQEQPTAIVTRVATPPCFIGTNRVAEEKGKRDGLLLMTAAGFSSPHASSFCCCRPSAAIDAPGFWGRGGGNTDEGQEAGKQDWIVLPERAGADCLEGKSISESSRPACVPLITQRSRS